MRVYIDGENFRKGLARILINEKIITNSREINSYAIRDLLADVLESRDLDINYYASKIKLPNGYKPDKEVMQHVQKIKDFTRKWVPQLKKQNINYTKAGYLKVKSSKKCPRCGHGHDTLQEKGVDVRLAVDMLEQAYSQKNQVMAMMSSDTDLCPAIKKVQDRGSKVIYVCFGDSPNRAVSAVSDETATISKAKLIKYAKVKNA